MLQPTAVVHEAYLRLLGLDRIDWQNRAQFMEVAAQLMRRILTNYARQRIAEKRGGSGGRADFEVEEVAAAENPAEMLAVDMAVTRLAELNPEQSQVVEMRYFEACRWKRRRKPWASRHGRSSATGRSQRCGCPPSFPDAGFRKLEKRARVRASRTAALKA